MATIWPVIAVIVVLAVLAKNPELFGKLKGGSEKLGLSDPRILIAIGVIVFNLVSWAMIPWFWDVLFYKWYTLVFFNVGLWSVLYLGTIKVKDDKSKKDTEKTNPTASKLASIITIVLVLGLVTTAWQLLKKGWEESTSASSSIVNRTSTVTTDSISFDDAPQDVAFPIIAGCESGGKQFNEDGSVVHGNVNPHDIGYLQINEVVHLDLINEHNELNIYKSKDDNLKMGEIIREKYHGYGPWYLSQACWGPILAGKGYGQGVDSQNIVTLVPLEATVGHFGERLYIRSGMYFDWADSEGAFVLQDQKGSVVQYDSSRGIQERMPYPSKWIEAKSLSDKPAIVKLRLRNRPF